MRNWWAMRTEKFKKTIMISGFGFLILGAVQAKMLVESIAPQDFTPQNPNATEQYIDKSTYHISEPDSVRGIYISAAAAGSHLVDGLLNYVVAQKMNAVVIDTKDWLGRPSFFPKH